MTPKPRILVDARMAGAQGHGIGLYVRQMANGLSRLAPRGYEVFYLVPPTAPADSPLRRQPHAECAIPFLSRTELVTLPSVIRRFGPALYHTPSFSSLLRYPCPYVQTVHDLNHLVFGSLAQKAYYRFVLLPSLMRADAALAVSETAALEIRGWLARHGAVREVAVAPNAIEPFPVADDAAVLRRFGLERENYFFCLANPKPHKNLAMLERAYASALAVRDLPPLVVSVPGAGARGIVRTGPLGDAEVGALLRGAKSFYFPSLYEGFGRPPLEAALAGAIPVVSSLAVHREVLDGVKEAVFLDPATESSWVDSFLRMANVSDRVGEASRGWIRATWSEDRLARKMGEIYQQGVRHLLVK